MVLDRLLGTEVMSIINFKNISISTVLSRYLLIDCWIFISLLLKFCREKRRTLLNIFACNFYALIMADVYQVQCWSKEQLRLRPRSHEFTCLECWRSYNQSPLSAPTTIITALLANLDLQINLHTRSGWLIWLLFIMIAEIVKLISSAFLHRIYLKTFNNAGGIWLIKEMLQA